MGFMGAPYQANFGLWGQIAGVGVWRGGFCPMIPIVISPKAVIESDSMPSLRPLALLSEVEGCKEGHGWC